MSEEQEKTLVYAAYIIAAILAICLTAFDLDASENIFNMPEEASVGDTLTAEIFPVLLLNNKVQHVTAVFSSATPTIDLTWYLNGTAVQSTSEASMIGSVTGGNLRMIDSYTPTSSGTLILESSQTIDGDSIIAKQAVRIGQTDFIKGRTQSDFIHNLKISERTIQDGSVAVLITGYSGFPYDGTFAIIVNRGTTDVSGFAPRAYDYGSDIPGAVGGINYATSTLYIFGATYQQHFIKANVLDTDTAGNHTITFFQSSKGKTYIESIGSFVHEEQQTIDTTNIDAIVSAGIEDATRIILGDKTIPWTIRTTQTIQKVNINTRGYAGDIYAPSGAEIIQFVRTLDPDDNEEVVCQLIEWHPHDNKPSNYIQNTTNDGKSLVKIITAFPVLAGIIEQVTPPWFD